MLFRKWRGIPAQLAAIITNQITINQEIRSMRASTQHLINSVSALAAAVASSTKEISELVVTIKNANDAGDDVAINEAADRIAALSTSLTEAVSASDAAVQSTPSDGASGLTDPAAMPPDAVLKTGVDPASGAPAGQGAVGAGDNPQG